MNTILQLNSKMKKDNNKILNKTLILSYHYDTTHHRILRVNASQNAVL